MSLRLRLKEGTADLHDAIEATPFMSRLLKPDLRKEGYISFLASMLGLNLEAERKINLVSDFSHILRDWPRRKKSESLRLDLKALGHSAEVLPGPTLTVTNASQALGVVYVLEGSTLGGQVIAKKLAERDFVNEACLHYFHHYGEETGRYWQSFVRQLEAAESIVNPDEVLASARATFQTMIANQSGSSIR